MGASASVGPTAIAGANSGGAADSSNVRSPSMPDPQGEPPETQQPRLLCPTRHRLTAATRRAH
eukprot:9282738-Lingulodinium_polyedra.AAC.1